MGSCISRIYTYIYTSSYNLRFSGRCLCRSPTPGMWCYIVWYLRQQVLPKRQHSYIGIHGVNPKIMEWWSRLTETLSHFHRRLSRTTETPILDSQRFEMRLEIMPSKFKFRALLHTSLLDGTCASCHILTAVIRINRCDMGKAKLLKFTLYFWTCFVSISL